MVKRGRSGRWKWAAALAAMAGLSVACAAEPAALGAGAALSAAAATAGAAGHRGALFRVSRDGQTAWLFGTVHVGQPAFYPLPAEATRALDAAPTLVVELDTRADAPFQQALAAHGLYPEGDTLARHLSAPTLARLERVLAVRGRTLDAWARLKPWLVANLLTGLEIDQLGYQRAQGLEFFLLEHARTHGSRVAELESADSQLAMFDSMDAAAAERYLDETLVAVEDGSARRNARALLEAWAAGDPARQEALLRELTRGDGATARFTRNVLLGPRNAGMAAGIERVLAQGSPAFVGVGLLHLLGEQGVPKLLAAHGFQVERVY
ncbi:MAG: TraB/GumN family protein [Telluria sp.]